METKGAVDKNQFPYTLTKRNGKATIYRSERVKGGRVYVEYRLATYDSTGKRSLGSFADFDAALRDADARLTAMGRGLADTLTLSGPDRLDYLHAKKLLPPGTSFTDAVQAFLRAEKGKALPPIRISELVDQFVASRETETRHGRPASDAYLRDLRLRLGRFAEGFSCDVGEVTAPLIEQWLNAEKQTGRNRFNTLCLIRTLLKWARKRGFIDSGPLPTDGLDFAVPLEGEIQIFTPKELASLLRAAKPELIPYLVLGAFAGLRTAETQRLDWSDLKLERGFVEVGRDKAKTRSRRLVPVLPALSAWLQPLRQTEGPVVPYANIAKQVGWLSRDASIEWKHNGLRHSFISYRLAEVQSADRVALEAGNSPMMLFRHYRELVTPTDAAEWFAIRPVPVSPASVFGEQTPANR